MTNTLESMYSAATSGITGTVDGFLGLGLAILIGLAGFAIVSKFIPRKKKVV